MNDFFNYCLTTHPNLHSNLEKHFREHSYQNYSPSEFTLGIYLLLNLQKVFPECKEVILYESELIHGRTDYGTADFVCLTYDNKIMLIELKYIDLETSGKSAKNKRNKKRQKVLSQVTRWKRVLEKYYNVPSNDIFCGIFTTDPISVWRAQRLGIKGNFIPISNLREWIKEISN